LNKVILIFHDTISIAEFILQNKISGAEVNTREKALSAVLSEEEIEIACTAYRAILRTKFTASIN
jgi:hypothetical protein